MDSVSVLILAGGRSERMKTPKPFLWVQGKTFIENISEGYLQLGATNIGLVLNSQYIGKLTPHIPQVKVIPNSHPENGRVYSLHLGLKQLPPSDYVFIHNVDNPFVEKEVIFNMWASRSENAYVVPTHLGKSGHPVLIPKRIVRAFLATSNVSCTLRDVLRKFPRIETESESRKIFVNINTWNDYEEEVLNLIPEDCCD